ncbi:MAG: PepSY-like domain-containing protein [Luteolibacter sp.]
MKKIMGMAGVGLLALGIACAQEKTPDAVKKSFDKLFPGITAKWEKEKNEYEATFKKDGGKMSASFDRDGNWLETETEITAETLPLAVSDYIARQYKSAKIREAAKISRSDGKVYYEAEVGHKDVLFDESGHFLKEEKK